MSDQTASKLEGVQDLGHDDSALGETLGGAKPSGQAPRLKLHRDGEFWNVSFDGQSARVKHAMGITLYKELISRPMEDVIATVLSNLEPGVDQEDRFTPPEDHPIDGCSALEPSRSGEAVSEGDHEWEPSRSEEYRIRSENRRIKKDVAVPVDRVGDGIRPVDHQNDEDPVVYGDALSITLGGVNSPRDDENRRVWEGVLEENRAALRDARKSGNIEAVEETLQELARWQRERSRLFNHKWRERDRSALLERARHRVDGLLRTARKNLGQSIPGLEEHLKNCVTGSGGAFSYDPDKSAPVKRREKVDRAAQAYEKDGCKLVGGWYAGRYGWPAGGAGSALVEEHARRKSLINQWLTLHKKLLTTARQDCLGVPEASGAI